MTIKIHAINKSDLSYVNGINVLDTGLTKSNGMTISHFADATIITDATIPYEIDIVKEHVPIIKEIDFCLTVRKRVNMTAIGVNGKTREDIGEDIGKDNYVNNVPARPLDLPPGFNQLYKQ